MFTWPYMKAHHTSTQATPAEEFPAFIYGHIIITLDKLYCRNHADYILSTTT